MGRDVLRKAKAIFVYQYYLNIVYAQTTIKELFVSKVCCFVLFFHTVLHKVPFPPPSL